jgi:peptide deformylase
MAILKIAHLGSPVLRVPADPVETIQAPDIQRLIDDMIETMGESHTVALAAPQVHRSLQIVVIAAEHGERPAGAGPPSPIVLLNPHVVTMGNRVEEDWEGCPSIPSLRGKVPRLTAIEVRAHDRRGESFALKASHFLARLIQHATDHLVGKLFLDRMTGCETLTFQEEFERYWLSPGGQVLRGSASHGQSR